MAFAIIIFYHLCDFSKNDLNVRGNALKIKIETIVSTSTLPELQKYEMIHHNFATQLQ